MFTYHKLIRQKSLFPSLLGFSIIVTRKIIKLLINGVDYMGRLVHRNNEFIVIEDDHRKKGHIIINTKGKYSNHGHVKYLNSCKKLLRLMDKEVVPDNPYLRETVLRISLDEKYRANVLNKIEKDKQKPKYFNPNKGVRK